ncbi:MAG: hypothetical protein ACUVTY_07555 [Armatimonadota bacterium]
MTRAKLMAVPSAEASCANWSKAIASSLPTALRRAGWLFAHKPRANL